MIHFYQVSQQFLHEDTLFTDLNIDFPEVGWVGILGPSGCGKSTLLNMMTGFLKPSQGDILYQGKSLFLMSRTLKKHYQYQDICYFHQFEYFIDSLTVEENLKYDMQYYRCLEKWSFIDQKIKEMSLEHCLKLYPKQLSGGQRQKLALLRCFMTKAKVFLLDEPTASLDGYSASEIMHFLKSFSKDHLIIMVSHHEENVRTFCDYMIHFDDLKTFSKEMKHHYHIRSLCVEQFNIHWNLLLKYAYHFVLYRKGRYFFTWISLILSFFLSLCVFQGYQSSYQISFKELEEDYDSQLVLLIPKEDTLTVNDYDYLENLEGIEELVRQEGHHFVEIHLKEGVSLSDIEKDLSSYEYQSDYQLLKENLDQFYQILGITLSIFVLMNTLLGFILFYILLKSSLNEQKREMAMMLIKGYRHIELLGIYMIQALCLTLCASIGAFLIYHCMYPWMNKGLNYMKISFIFSSLSLSNLALFFLFISVGAMGSLLLVKDIFFMQPIDIIKGE